VQPGLLDQVAAAVAEHDVIADVDRRPGQGAAGVVGPGAAIIGQAPVNSRQPTELSQFLQSDPGRRWIIYREPPTRSGR
jgi:hypothetical protein